jgi:hypothetical protein
VNCSQVQIQNCQASYIESCPWPTQYNVSIVVHDFLKKK